jgi:hypothetical protein
MRRPYLRTSADTAGSGDGFVVGLQFIARKRASGLNLAEWGWAEVITS